MEDLLGGLGGEHEYTKRELDVETSPVVDEMCKGFEVVLHTPKMRDIKPYDLCEECVPAKYGARDVQQFSVLLANYQSAEHFTHQGGLYLSALINHCPDKEVTVITEHLEKDLRYLGCRNSGHSIRVCGSVGLYVGMDMSCGEITVEEDAGNYMGEMMSGGVIRVEGVSGTLSERIKQGSIYHKGVQIVRDGREI